jgi:hypothetical protein
MSERSKDAIDMGRVISEAVGGWNPETQSITRVAEALIAAGYGLRGERTDIGYVCRHGHFQFNEDPDGDSCGTKIVGRIYVTPEPEITPEELSEALGYSLESHHRKMEEWRNK